ncbi:leukemia inhibitory factor receptor isoform X1 [Labrus mixtus]|uniref:leukemia inhibitory factor receptor isoform X1 n=2 Tax=Labrus mixtus TaxID=508554 RepID=UPI0029C00E66|nr:leukemia inhibitory factor receptor isoform X1 [Labrus mixtus]
MIPLRISLVCLLWLYLISSEDTVWQLSRPSITHLQALSDRQSLLVSWQLNHSSLLGDVYEIQIGRTLNYTIIYNRNISVPSIDSHEYTWTSDLPLECVDHSVRIRSFYNKSVPSPWSSWKTNDGAQAKNRTKIFPFQRVLREGTSAMFCCVPPLGVTITSISINNSPQPLISISDRVKAITVEKLKIVESFIDALSIICSDDAGNNRHIFNYVSSPPQKPKNLSCVTSDMKTVTCTWDSDRKQELDNHNKKTHTLHIQNSDQPPILCDQLSCTFPAIPQLEEYNISVEVKDLLGKETESYSFNISDRVFPVVARCSVSPGVTDTTVSWFMLWNLTQVSLLCQVNTVPGVTTVMTCNSVREFCKVKLEHLQPNTRYTTRVRCSADGRLWGKWTQPVTFKTYPLVTLDVWRRITQLPDQNSRQVTLMWTPAVTGSAATVNIEGYKVQWSQGGRNQTELKSSGQTQAEVSIGPGQCDFTVQAVVPIGSTVPAQITVPQQDDQDKNASEKWLSSNSAAGFNLSWAQDETATCGYTVDWCILGNAVPCTLRWVKMSEGNNTLFLPGRHFKAGCRYTFSIFGCKENAHRLLEMQTGYLQELKSVPSPSLVGLVRSTSSSVTLEWFYSEDDASHPAFITGYLITVQELGSVTLSGHVSDLLNVLVSDPHRKSVTIEGLQQNQEYTFSVSALTKEGPGQAASITVRTKTNYSSLMVKILTPLFLLLGCIVLLWPQRKTLQRGLVGIIFYPAGMNIKTPELDRCLQETGEWLQSQKPEECRSCEIEILTNRPLLNDSTPRDPEALNTPPPPGPQSSLLNLPLSCDLLQAEYCPQLWDRAPLQQTTYVTNKSYFPPPS